MSKRIAVGLSYDGAAYHGWQRQTNQPELPTVQYYVERAFTFVANHQLQVTCAGRTDARVHAVGQVIHFDTDAVRDDYSWVFGANSNLPPDISVAWAKEIDREFHARFMAEERSYRYIIYNHQIRPSISRNFVTWIRKPLDVSLMQLGARFLVGEHDFSSFRGADCQAKSAIRELISIEIHQKSRMIIMDITANAFLLHMVRNIAGVLIPIGQGIQPPEWAKQVLEARQRSKGGVTAAPNGLYLTSVTYPQRFDLPKNSNNPLFLL
jgi:tRNA pseudouridine38-40 synthase